MKRKNLFLLIIVMPAIVYSCKKNPEPVIPATNYPDFSQLKTGNYWIYEQFDINPAGEATSKKIFDSCYVEKDTVINNKIYHKIVKPVFYNATQKEISFQKDSLHYIINSNGKILFSSQDFSTILNYGYIKDGEKDTISKVIRQMTDKNTTVTTAAGTFATLNAKETCLMYPKWSFAGNPRYRHSKYAENVGIIIETLPFFTSSPNYIERRLVRYHLN